jgi:uncharacterized protein YbaP (TraB family)
MLKMLLTAAALAAVTAPGWSAKASPLPDADPAIWVVKDEDTTVYLFGTFHVLDGKADWFNDEVKTAFDKSDEVVLEALLPEDPAAVGPIIAKYAIDPAAPPMAQRLSPAAAEKLAKLLAGSGIPAAAVDKMKTGFAGMTVALIPYQAAGMTADKGTEMTLTKAAKAAGKPLSELEGLEFQMQMLDRIPEAAHRKGLEETLLKFDELPKLIDSMKVNWNSGNAEGFATLMKEMQASSPESYKVMMSDRNKAWAEWVQKRLDKPGTVFVAVGTAHLAGADSVQAFLGQRGITSARVVN